MGCVWEVLIFIRENPVQDVIYETFSETEERFGEEVIIDLKPGGRDVDVTDENKKEYVEYVHLLQH
jgi:E3 ubiquitin-protein ligase NEDD4